MEEKKEIKREDFVKVLNTFFPDGYSGDLDAWQTCWFCGWSSIEIEDKWDVALSINVDTKTSIVFDFINSKNTDIKK